MELLTKLIILATAIVGLYKAATFDRAQSGARSGSGPLAPFIHFAGILLFMLAFPAFIWGFQWLVSSMPLSHTSTAPRELVPKLPEIPKEATNADVLLAAAGGLPYSQSQSAALSSVVSYALSEHDYKTAVRAALMIPYSSDQERELQKVIKAMTGDPKAKPSTSPKVENSATATPTKSQ
jgi:hypothetical protein